MSAQRSRPAWSPRRRRFAVLAAALLAGGAVIAVSPPARCAETVRCPEPGTSAAPHPVGDLRALWTYARAAALAAGGDYAGAMAAGIGAERCP